MRTNKRSEDEFRSILEQAGLRLVLRDPDRIEGGVVETAPA